MWVWNNLAWAALCIVYSFSEIPSAEGLIPLLVGFRPQPRCWLSSFQHKFYYEGPWLSLKPQFLPAGKVSWGRSQPCAVSVFFLWYQTQALKALWPCPFNSPAASPLPLAMLTTLLGFEPVFCSIHVSTFLDIRSPGCRESCGKCPFLRDLVLCHGS